MVANAGESDIVLVYMMDRFSRGEYDAPIYKRELAQHGVKLVSALEQIPDSPEGIIYESCLRALRRASRRRPRSARGAAWRATRSNVRPTACACSSYASNEADEYVINEDEAAFVREAFKRRIAKGGHQLDSSRLRGTRVKTSQETRAATRWSSGW